MSAEHSPAGHGAPPQWFRLRSALGLCAPMMSSGVILPFFPVWLQSRGFAAEDIAVVLAVPMIVRVFVAPAVAYLADRLEERRDVLVWSAALSVVLAAALLTVDGFWAVMILFTLMQAAISPYAPVVESVLMTGVRRWGYDYGSMRLWGSLGFVVATLAVGRLVATFGGGVIAPVIIFCLGVAVAASFVVPRVGNARRRQPILAGGSANTGSLVQLHLQMLLIGACLVQSSHAMLYTFSSIYWQEIGFSGTAVGILWSAALFGEITVFAFARRLLRWLGPWTMIRLGCTLAVCRWLLFPMPLGFAGYMALQATHAFTFAFVHVGVQQRIVQAVGESHEASAQGNYFFYNGAFLAACTVASGMLYREFGMAGYHFMAGLAAIGLGIVIVSWYLLPSGKVSGGNASEQP